MKTYAFEMTCGEERGVMIKRLSTKRIHLAPSYAIDNVTITVREVTEEEAEALTGPPFPQIYAWLVDSILEEIEE